jgi:hypothetical protein
MHPTVSFADLDALRSHVLARLCERDMLDSEQTTLHEAPITRRARCCGLFFQVQGPRRVRNYAVWAAEEGRILFYDSTGIRYGETRVLDAPDARGLAA